MWDLFQEILIDKLTPNQLLLLYGINNSISISTINPNTEILELIKHEYVIYELDNINFIEDYKSMQHIVITEKGKNIMQKYDDYFKKSKNKTSIEIMGKEYTDKVEEYRELFPAGKLPHGKPARVNTKTLINNFRWFFENYNYTWDEIIEATRRYVNEYAQKDYNYMQTSQYFISKEDKSKIKQSQLADYCDMIKDGVEEENNTHFSENVI